MLSFLTWMEIPFFVTVKVIVTNFDAFSSSTFTWGFLSSWDHSYHVICSWHDASQSWVDASELIISSAGGEIKDFPLYRMRFCIHQCSFSLACFDRLSCPCREDLQIIPWIWCCCKALYYRGAGRTAIAAGSDRV